jgi:PAS domain S-box-containing protein
MALKIMEIMTAGTVYVNGKTVATVGSPGRDMQNSIPDWRPLVYDFETSTNTLDVIAHISNFHHNEGGIHKPILLGTESRIREIILKKRGFELFLVGSLFIMGLYHIGLWTLRRNEGSTAIFGVFCFILALYALLTGEIHFVHLFPNASWQLVVKLIYLSFYFSVPVFFMFIHSLYPQECRMRYVRIVQLLCILFSALLIFSPPKVFLPTVRIYHLICLVQGFYITYVLILAYRRKREGVGMFMLGFAVLFAAAINDILNSNRLIVTAELSPFGLFVFLFSQAFLLSQRFSKAFNTVEHQREVLSQTNRAYSQEIVEHKKAQSELVMVQSRLEELVAKRTHELECNNCRLEDEIEEHRTTEKALRQSEQRYRTIFESILDTYFRITADGIITEISPSGARLLDYGSTVELNCKHFTRDLCADVKEGQKFQAELKERGRVAHFELRLKRRDGTIIFVEIMAHIIFDESGRPIGSEGMIRDISERKKSWEKQRQLEDQLIRSRKMEALGLLAGGVAHDLNNVLSGVVAYPELLLLDLPEDSSFKKPLKAIQSSGQRAAAIVQDLLTLAQRGVLQTEVLNLNSVISDYLVSVEYQKFKHDYPCVELEANLANDLMNVCGSQIYLYKSVTSLIANAAEAQPSGGKILVSTANRYVDQPISGYDTVNEGDYAVLRMQDFGSGISSEDMDRIFEPFYTKKAMGRSGSGLGMALVWGTIRDHNGYIHVNSTPGTGTTFELYLPITREEVREDVEPIIIDSCLARGEKILIVDDISYQREIAACMLQKLGYATDAVASGEEAVEYIQNNEVDLIVLDMIMDPGIDGLETYRRIKKLRPDQKAIIASGFSEGTRVKKAQELGAGAYVRKPYTIEKIAQALQDELKK